MKYLLAHYYLLISILFIPSMPAYAQSHLSPESSSTLDPPVSASIGTHRNPDFFIVNSVFCPQKINWDKAHCEGITHRYLPDNKYHPSNSDAMIAALKPGVPVCLAVHGSFVKPQEFYTESIKQYKRIIGTSKDRPIHFIAIHWPSDPGLLVRPIHQVRQLGKCAESNGIFLARLITRIPSENPVSLIGHSHGCRVISSALHLLGGGRVEGVGVSNPYLQRRMRVVFGAAAVDQHWLNPGARYGCALNRIECLLNIRNRMDTVLKMYPLTDPYLQYTIGQAGFRFNDLVRIGIQANKIVDYDVSYLVGTGHMISHYAVHPQIRITYMPYLYFD